MVILIKTDGILPETTQASKAFVKKLSTLFTVIHKA